jgi:hypothetical protein
MGVAVKHRATARTLARYLNRVLELLVLDIARCALGNGQHSLSGTWACTAYTCAPSSGLWTAALTRR